MSLRSLAVSLVLAVAAGGCGPTEVGNDIPDGGGIIGQQDGPQWGSEGGIDQPPPDNCSAEAKLVYVVDENGTFSSFDPHPTPPVFTDLGTLACPVGLGETPFSMSVDRDAIAWVLSSAGNLYRVDIKNNLSCVKAVFQASQAGLDLFGMGFVSNTVGSTLDTLYVAGGTGPGAGANATLATITFPDLQVHTIRSVSGWPELTGNANAELWGFYPDATSPKVARIDKQTAVENPVYALPGLRGQPTAWAFAFWGGDFWVFLMKDLESSTTVYKVKGTDGSMSVAVQTNGRTIVGAGVSTCAPVVID
ncbi:MAG TPA: hypothetical protein VGQ83_05060 [Polyangia bacterium]|jgi:hypothetical protein